MTGKALRHINVFQDKTFALPAHLIVIAVVVFALSVSMVFPGSFLVCGVVHEEAASGPTSITNTGTCEVFIWECWLTTSDLTTELSINSLEGKKDFVRKNAVLVFLL